MSSTTRTDTAEYIAFVRRILRASAQHVADASPDDLVDLLQLRDEVNLRIGEAARGLHAAGHTWGEIGTLLGCSRQAAWERFGKAAAATDV